MSDISADVVAIGPSMLSITALQPEAMADVENAGRIVVSVGGVSRNVAENLARLGIRTALVSIVGQDIAGQLVVRETTDAGVLFVIPAAQEVRTPVYVSFLDGGGDVLTDRIDFGSSYELYLPEMLIVYERLLSCARYVVLCSDLSREFVQEVARTMEKCPKLRVCLLASAQATCRRVTEWVRLMDVDILAVNRREAELVIGRQLPCTDAVQQAVEMMVELYGVRVAIISSGDGAVCFAERDSRAVCISALKLGGPVRSASGGGDALLSGVLLGQLMGKSLPDSIDIGLAAAALTVMSYRDVSRALTRQAISHLLGRPV